MNNAFPQQTMVVLGVSGSLDRAIQRQLALEALRPLLRCRRDRLSAERPLPRSARTAEISKERATEGTRFPVMFQGGKAGFQP